ncbi:hypothetical protein ACFW2V_12280 [Streptomyces sp. NPDC058947]|uniref:hypothetical protein n=1 Tax=Streptomyces sp. NPDC058947 TaxID=3346675 RepID=UPI0036864BA3
MSKTLEPSSYLDSTSFTLPPKVAKLDAVRKLIPRLMEVTGLGETAATTLAHAATDPTAVRNALAEPLPALTAHKKSHLQVIPTRVWTPWVTAPADDIPRYGTQKRFPVSDPSIPRTPRWEETPDGLCLDWGSPADRDWHQVDNRKLYSTDIYRDSLRIFPEHGGIVTPLVLTPQTETFQSGDESMNLLRVADGRYRYYGVLDLLERYADLDQDGLDGHFGPGVITPEVFRAALDRDRIALAKLVNATRDACTRADSDGGAWQYIGVHHLASILSLPAYIAVGTVDPVTSEIRPMGTDQGYPAGVGYTLETGVTAWHSGNGPARLIAAGQKEHNGLLLPEAGVDIDLVDVAFKRLRARGVPKHIIEFGRATQSGRAAARFAWWMRAIKQLNGTPATAVAAFAKHVEPNEGAWPQDISRSLLACAAYVMEEGLDTVYPPGDYRDPETRPDSLSLLVTDARNLTPVAALSESSPGKLLAHPRWHNARDIALAHLALTGALPAEEPLPEHVLNPHLLSRVAMAWANNQVPVLAKADGTEIRDSSGRAIPVDRQALGQREPEWVRKLLWSEIQYMLPPSSAPSRQASHAFRLRHDVVYTIPSLSIDDLEIDATPESIAAVVRRWFPDATGITLTDWSDKLVTGVMVGSVWVRLFDRRGEREAARSHGVWYPEGRPAGTKDELDWEKVNSGAPVGRLLGAIDFNGYSTEGFEEADEAMFLELNSDIIQEIDDALEAQKAADIKAGNQPDTRWEVPVLRLPEAGREQG